MFKIARNPTFIHAVTVMVPVDDTFDPQTFRCRYRALSVDEFAIHDLVTPEGTETFLRAACIEFFDIGDDDGNPVAHSDAIKDQLLGSAYVRIALTRTYFEAMTKARVGN